MRRRPAASAPAPAAALAAAADLLGGARRSLAEAVAAARPEERYVAAHLAALRTAAAVLAGRARPAGAGTRRPRSVWAVLPVVAPELGEWAAFFAAGAGKRAAAEAGLRHAVSQREADDLLRDAETFLGVVAALLGLADQLPLPTAG